MACCKQCCCGIRAPFLEEDRSISCASSSVLPNAAHRRHAIAGYPMNVLADVLQWMNVLRPLVIQDSTRPSPRSISHTPQRHHEDCFMARTLTPRFVASRSLRRRSKCPGLCSGDTNLVFPGMSTLVLLGTAL